MDLIKIKKLPENWLIPDEDGWVTELKENVEYLAADKGDYYRIYTPEDCHIPKENVEVVEVDTDF